MTKQRPLRIITLGSWLPRPPAGGRTVRRVAPVKIDLGEVARAVGARAAHEFAEMLPADDQFQVVGPVKGNFAVSNTGRLLVLTGGFRGRVSLACARCLDPAEVDVQGALQEQFRSQTPGVTMPTDTIDAEEPREAAYSDGVLDLTELLRQQVALSLPLRPLCKPDCRGLCPNCGKNMNREQCTCPREPLDSPAGWRAELSKLVQKQRGSAGSG